MKFNEILKNLRKENNLELKKVANDLSIPYNNLGKYERGECEPSIDTLILLADYYHVSIDYLLRGNDNISIPKEEYKELKDTKTLYDKVINDLSKVIHERDRI